MTLREPHFSHLTAAAPPPCRGGHLQNCPSCFNNPANEATWRSGYAADCKSVHPGSIPGVASNSGESLSR